MSTDLEPGVLETDHVEVRTLGADDLDWMVRIDEKHSGRRRTEYLRLKLHEAQADTGVRISLGAWVDGEPCGYLMGRVYYGEFGIPEPMAVLDHLGVSPAFTGRRVGAALMRQFRMNLRGLNVETVQTQVDWDQLDLIGFFQKAGFRPSSRLCLEMPVG